MRKIKQYLPDFLGLTVLAIAFLVYLSGNGVAPAHPEGFAEIRAYQGQESSVYELNANETAAAIVTLFPGKATAAAPRQRIVRSEKPVRDSSDLAYVSSSVLENGKTVYMFVDNTINRIYTLAIGESNGGLTLKKADGDYFLIETADSIERVRKQK